MPNPRHLNILHKVGLSINGIVHTLYCCCCCFVSVSLHEFILYVHFTNYIRTLNYCMNLKMYYVLAVSHIFAIEVEFWVRLIPKKLSQWQKSEELIKQFNWLLLSTHEMSHRAYSSFYCIQNWKQMHWCMEYVLNMAKSI